MRYQNRWNRKGELARHPDNEGFTAMEGNAGRCMPRAGAVEQDLYRNAAIRSSAANLAGDTAGAVVVANLGDLVECELLAVA